MLALEWYRSTPLPDKQAWKDQPDVASPPTELSRRLLAAFDAHLHCDVFFQSGADTAPVGAHRVVLLRNPHLSLCDSCAPLQLSIPPGVSTENMHAVVRAHYLEVDNSHLALDAGILATGPQRKLMELRSHVREEELGLLEQTFGPLDAGQWAQLRVAVTTGRFTDCTLRLSACGIDVPAHRAVVAGIDDGHFFSASLRWPGGSGDGVIALPEGLSHDALLELLRLRYGGDDVDVEHILEIRHFAELLDWPDVARVCETQLEVLLADARTLDAEGLLAVVAHVDQTTAMPARLRAAALSAAVRQWAQVTEAAAASLTADRRIELSALSRVRRRDGHVCGDLQEYLHACADDLTEWERSLTPDAPTAVRRDIERAWEHWRQILFEHGRVSGAKSAEKWLEKVRTQRELLREERALNKGMQLQLPAGRVWFEPTGVWREVPQNAICPAGLEYRFDMQTGKNFARFPS